jgi:hypothetical protein
MKALALFLIRQSRSRDGITFPLRESCSAYSMLKGSIEPMRREIRTVLHVAKPEERVLKVRDCFHDTANTVRYGLEPTLGNLPPGLVSVETRLQSRS